MLQYSVVLPVEVYVLYSYISDKFLINTYTCLALSQAQVAALVEAKSNSRTSSDEKKYHRLRRKLKIYYLILFYTWGPIGMISLYS